MTVTETKKATVTLRLTCPHCDYNLNTVQPEDQYYDGHDRGRGGFRTVCDSCGVNYIVERETVLDAQELCLRLLGEA